MKKNLGQKILKRAKEIIPGGNQLLSKRSEMFLPNYWPNYYKKVREFGILKINILRFWRSYCRSLGYANKKINSIIKAFNMGI